VAGAAFQITDLQAGDVAWVVADLLLYYCEDPTPGAAIWTAFGSGGGGPPTGPAGGDLSGTYPNPLVDGLQGNPVSAVAPIAGQALVWDGASWVPTAIPGGSQVVSGVGAIAVPAGVAVGDVVYVSAADSADQADNTSAATTPAIGVVLAKPTAVTATVLYLGEAPVFVGLTPGVEYFVGLVGGITTVAPTGSGDIVQRVGVALNATTLIFNPDPTTVVI
jgi:hypothetical protein